MHKGKSMFLTILCMGVILGFGYLLIMESGQKVLENGIMLEETDYESTSSNIFYGKIEEDIEVFPWNYYPGDEAGLGWKTESGIHPMFQYSMLSDDDDSVEEELKSLQSWYLCQMIAYKTNSTPSEVWSIFEKKQHTIMDEICMVENSPVGALFFYEDMLSIKGKRYQVRVSFTQWNIINFVCMEEREQYDSGSQGSSGTQASVKKRMALGSQKSAKSEDGRDTQAGARSQVAGGSQGSSGTQSSVKKRMALGSQENAKSEGSRGIQASARNQAEWEEGKESLAKILGESEEQMEEYFAYMSFLRDWDDTVFYVGDMESYANCYLESLQWLDQIQRGKTEKNQGLAYILERMEEIKYVENSMYNVEDMGDYKAKDADSALGEEKVETEEKMGVDATAALGEPEEEEYGLVAEQEAEPAPSFSYQIVDLKDMILLLMQGESTIGIFYDPIAQEFCGYNFFYEY